MKRIKIPAFRYPSKTDLKAFRSAVATLKREGLIPANRQGRAVKVASARPGDMYQGKALRDYVRDKDNQAVLSGDAITIARSRVEDTQGFKVKKPRGTSQRVIIPVSKDSKVSVEKKQIVIKHVSEKGVIKRTMLPRKNLKQYLSDAESLPELSGNKFYAFYFYGNRSHSIFRNAQDLVEYLMAYNAVEIEDDKEIFRNLEILEITSASDWHAKVAASVKRRRQGGKRSKEAQRRRMERMPEWKKKINREKRTKYMREYRKRKG